MPETNSNTLTPLQRLVRLLARFKREIRLVILYAVVIGGINLSLPLGVQALIGLIAGGSISASWGVLILFIGVGALLVGLLRIMQLSIMENLQRRVFTDSAIEFALRIPRLNLETLRREHLPEMVNRFFDTLTIQKGVPKLVIEGSTAALQILFSLMLLSFYHASFVMFSLLLLAIVGILFRWTVPNGLQSSLKESKHKYRLAYWLEEVGRVAATFKLAGENRYPLTRADAITSDYLDARAKHWRILLIQFASSVAFRVLVLVGFLVLGSLLVMENQLNIGQFVAAEILIIFVVDSLEKLILLHETGYDVLTAIEKIGQVADLELEREDGVRVEEFCPGGPFEVELRHLSYRFADRDRPVLDDLNLKIRAGERVVVCGYNSSGKSTLMQVLCVLRRDFSGSLLFNGMPKQNINLRSLRNHIGDFSSQEDLFKGSILENITLGRSEVPLPKVLKTIEEVGLTDFVREQPGGIQTELLPGGKNLPGSIVSKMVVARAVVTEPNLLVMEDPTQSLNYRDRLRIGQLLTDRSHPWTLVAVSEDPVLAALCDRVLVLREGQIIFDGSFDEVCKTEHFPKIFRTTADLDEKR